MGTSRGHVDLKVDVEEGQDHLLERVLISLGLVLTVALIYQLIVGGIRIEVGNGRLTIDAGGLVYWWHIVTGQVTPHR